MYEQSPTFTVQSSDAHRFLWAVCVGMEMKDLPYISTAVLKFGTACLQYQRSTTTCLQTMNLTTSIPKAPYNVVGGLFDDDNDAVVECIDCHARMNVNLDLACMQYDLYDTIPLQEFILPTVGSTWPAEKVFLRCMKSGKPQCTCTGMFFSWVTVPFNPRSAVYPMTLFIQRHRPVVEAVEHPVGRVPIPRQLLLGTKTYDYVGWTAKMCEMAMIPHLIVKNKMSISYCFLPGGRVQYVSPGINVWPADPRHLDMVIYRVSVL